MTSVAAAPAHVGGGQQVKPPVVVKEEPKAPQKVMTSAPAPAPIPAPAAPSTPLRISKPGQAAGGATSPGTPSATSASAAAGVSTPSGMQSPTVTTNLGLRILYADDETVNRKLMQRMLAKLGCDVTLLTDGDEVEAAFDEAGAGGQRPYDMLLLDIVMKRMSGDVVCRKLVRERGIAQPVIAVTGNARDFEELRRAGFCEIVEKPFTAEKLLAAMSRHLPK